MDFYKFVIRRLDFKARILLILTIITSLVSNLAVLITPILQKKLIDGLSTTNDISSNIFLYCLVGITGVVMVVAESIILSYLQRFLQRRLQEEMLKAALSEKNTIIKTKGSGAYLTSIFGDTEKISNLLELNVFNMAFQCSTVAVIVFITWKWFHVFVVIITISYIAMSLLNVLCDKVYVQNLQAGREIVFKTNPKVLEFIENRISLTGYTNTQNYLKEIYKDFDERDKYFCKAQTITALSTSVIGGIRIISICIFFACAIEPLQKGALQISEFVAMLSYFATMFVPIKLVHDFINNRHTFKILFSKIEKSLQEDNRLALPRNNDLIISDCSFTYEEKQELQLSDVTIKINKKIGVVGVSGEGKSTLIKVLLGELTPTKGSCQYGTVDTYRISKNLLLSTIRYYSQDIELFNNDMKFNIVLGKKEVSRAEYIKILDDKKREISDLLAKIKNNANDSKLTKKEQELIKNIFMLPSNGRIDKQIFLELRKQIGDNSVYVSNWISQIICSKNYYVKEKYEEIISILELDYLNGRSFGQRGKNISGGEKNKIALARFLLPEYGDYFIIDEPFVSLDAISDNRCRRILKKYISSMNGIIISHKLDIISDISDEICVMQEGKIVQKGTHEALIENSRLYSELYSEYISKNKI
ncbi:MAG: ABC transporter ATP-binding protein [Butyrivibrio sp.]|nr:ABC transporter ATP-binding protein [Butyrivibrio sp.]